LPASLFKAFSQAVAAALVTAMVIVGAALLLHEQVDPYLTIQAIQRALQDREYYNGEIDGITGSATRKALQDFQDTTGVDLKGMAPEMVLDKILKSNSSNARPSQEVRPLPSSTSVEHDRPPVPEIKDAISKLILSDAPSSGTNDPIADLIGPSPRIVAVQRVLSNYGYGQLKPTGLLDNGTSEAIEKFERDHKLPVSGRVSDRLVNELTAMTGHPIE
jgi:peptidoglycan hydrolase-like protein with peptidoglycan-binding domain